MEGNQGDHSGAPPEEWLSTGDMARLGETTLRTVRFYEAEGLICARTREDGSQRKFPPDELTKLRTISDLRDSGLSLQEIKHLMALKSGCSDAKQASREMANQLGQRITEVERRMATLERVRGELGSMLEMLRTCGQCTHPEFPKHCSGCELVDRPDVARTTQLLWKN